MFGKDETLNVRTIGQTLLLWGVAVLLAVILFGVLPRTWLGAALLVLVGPVALILVEAVGELAVGGLARVPALAGISDWAHRRTEGKRISAIRIAIALFWVLLIGGLVAGVAFLLDDTVVEQWVKAMGPFFSRHFR